MAEAIVLYVLVMLALLIMGTITWNDSKRLSYTRAGEARRGARMILAAPVWPIAAVVVVIRAIPRIIRDAEVRRHG